MSKRRAAFLTLGCKVNQYETDAMEEILEKNGYDIVSFKETADVYIINTCSVTNMADRKSRQMIHRAKKNNPDAVIVAVGARPIKPPIPGLDSENVVIVNDYYKEKDEIGDEVVVLGGGLAGCECAICLGMQGKRVHLVEMQENLAPDANVRHRPLLLQQIDRYVDVHAGCRVVRVDRTGAFCADSAGNEIFVPGKSIIAALGQRCCTDTVVELQNCAPFVRVIGDAAKVSTITNAVYWGYHAALDI